MKHLIPKLTGRYAELYQHLEAARAALNSLAPETLSETAAEQLLDYLQLIVDWNDRVDLVAPAPVEQLIERHLTDSLAAAILLSGVGCGRGFVDVGSGAGLPGVVLAVLDAERPIVLLEPREKRGVFLSEAKRRLGLKHARVVTERFEKTEPGLLREVGTAVFRALLPDATLLAAVSRAIEVDPMVAYLGGPSSRLNSVEWKATPVPYSLSVLGPERQLILAVPEKN